MQPAAPIIVIGGPTASGKTTLAIDVAFSLGTEIISFDSRQLYGELNIGVARPAPYELKKVRHHFIAEALIEEPWTAADYAAKARERLTDIVQRTGTAVLCGGTGLYLKALIFGLDDLPAGDAETRRYWQNRLDQEGLSALSEELIRLDPTAATQTDILNPQRVIRVLEILSANPGKKLSELRTGSVNAQTPWNPLFFGIDRPREELYQRINLRVDQMMKEGLVDEVKQLYHLRHLPVLKTVGYTEIFRYLDGELSLETATELIKQHTRNYAKRQLTWFRNQTPMIWLKPEQAAEMVLNAFSGLKLQDS